MRIPPTHTGVPPWICIPPTHTGMPPLDLHSTNSHWDAPLDPHSTYSHCHGPLDLQAADDEDDLGGFESADKDMEATKQLQEMLGLYVQSQAA